MADRNTCETCQHWCADVSPLAFAPAEDMGQCQRYAPRANGEASGFAAWPLTRPEWGCGEWIAAPKSDDR